jgi:hypothetical protein
MDPDIPVYVHVCSMYDSVSIIFFNFFYLHHGTNLFPPDPPRSSLRFGRALQFLRRRVSDLTL